MNNYSLYADEIQNRVTMKEVAEFYGVTFDHNGFAKCPFHSEKTASFKVQKNKWGHCFGCGWNGDVIKFLVDLFGLPFQAACERLNIDFNLALPIMRKPTLREQRNAEVRHKAVQAERAKQEADKLYEHELYWALWEAWIICDNAIRDFAPVNACDVIHPFYAEALKKIDKINYYIDLYL